MSKFRKKPVVIEAEQFLGWYDTQYHAYTVLDMSMIRKHNCLASKKTSRCPQCDCPFELHADCTTLEGVHIVCPNDWIIKGIKGEFYPCKPDIFELTYEKVEEQK